MQAMLADFELARAVDAWRGLRKRTHRPYQPSRLLHLMNTPPIHQSGAPSNLCRAEVAIAVLAVVGLAYLVQLARPLHLEPDSVCYILTAEGAVQGSGFDCPSCVHARCPIGYPAGYPAILAMLIKANMAGARTFVLVNLTFLAMGLISTFGILRLGFGFERRAALWLCSMFLLSFPVFKYSAVPLSEYAFFGLASTAVYLVTRAVRTEARWAAWLASAILLSFIAMGVRTIGIALIPALGWCMIGRLGGMRSIKALATQNRRVTVVVSAALVMLALSVGWAVLRSDYVTGDLPSRLADAGLVSMLLQTWNYRLAEWGQLAANVPVARVPAFFRVLLPGIGAIAFGVWVVAIWVRRRDLGPADIFLLAYVGIMLVWPYSDTRFWLPVEPLFLGSLGSVSTRLGRLSKLRFLMVSYCLLFGAAGVVGHAFNTRRALLGRSFALEFRDDYLGPAYRAAWGLPQAAPRLAVDSTAVRLILQYERRYGSIQGR